MLPYTTGDLKYFSEGGSLGPEFCQESGLKERVSEGEWSEFSKGLLYTKYLFSLLFPSGILRLCILLEML